MCDSQFFVEEMDLEDDYKNVFTFGAEANKTELH